MKRTSPFLLLKAMILFTIVSGCGCARVPKESVELSILMGRDLADVHAANRTLVRQLFATMRNDVDSFVDQEYRPFVLRKTMEDLDLVTQIRTPPEGLDPLDVMEIYVEESMGQIEKFRHELQAPIDEQEVLTLQHVDVKFNALRAANATLTAHLTSIRKVHETQEDLLDAVGLGRETRDAFIDQTAAISEQLNGLLKQAKVAQESLDALPGQVADVMHRP